MKGLWGKTGERNNLEDLSIYGKGIIKWTFKKWKGGGGMHWIELARDMDR